MLLFMDIRNVSSRAEYDANLLLATRAVLLLCQHGEYKRTCNKQHEVAEDLSGKTKQHEESNKDEEDFEGDYRFR